MGKRGPKTLYTTEIVANEMQMLDSKGGNTDFDTNNNPSSGAPSSLSSTDIIDDDIPLDVKIIAAFIDFGDDPDQHAGEKCMQLSEYMLSVGTKARAAANELLKIPTNKNQALSAISDSMRK